MQDWTTPSDLTRQVHRFWEKGRILAARINGEPLFPLHLRLRCPSTQAYSVRFAEVRNWIKTLEEGSRDKRGFGYDIEWDSINHRQLGRNSVPRAVSVPTEADAVKLIARQKEARQFEHVLQATKASFPDLLEWLARKPLVAIDYEIDWPRILAVIAWLQAHPQSNLYLRQLDIPGVDSKFIETRKPLLTELLDILLRRKAVPGTNRQAASFEQIYGLKSKPPIIRFRILDGSLAIGGLRDIATPASQFASLHGLAKRIFITENEINGLSFPDVADSIVVFGLGYGVELLGSATWIGECEIHYWSDIDTHGFAMLDRLRAFFPSARSLLMDQATLLSHRSLWGHEDVPFRGVLTRLDADELELFNALVDNRIGENLRLEQERVSFGRVCEVLHSITSGASRLS